MTQPIHLLPHPKDFTLGEGMFSLDVNTSILIPARAGDKALFVARQLQDEICQSTCLTVSIVKAFVPSRWQNWPC